MRRLVNSNSYTKDLFVSPSETLLISSSSLTRLTMLRAVDVSHPPCIYPSYLPDLGTLYPSRKYVERGLSLKQVKQKKKPCPCCVTRPRRRDSMEVREDHAFFVPVHTPASSARGIDK